MKVLQKAGLFHFSFCLGRKYSKESVEGFLLYFFLAKKSNKKVNAVRCGTLLRSKFSLDELPEREVHNPKGFRLYTLLRAMRGFLEAAIFSPACLFLPNVLSSEK